MEGSTMNKLKFFLIAALLLIHLSNGALAAEDDDWQVFGLEVEKLLNLGSGILAVVLFTMTFIAYRRTKHRKLLYVSAAFLLFALKGLLTSHELFMEEFSMVDPLASLLNFGILLAFFLGMVRK